MTQCFEFALARKGLERARFLVYRPDLAANGDCESAFLDGVEGLVRHPAGTALGAALGRAGAEGEVLILVRNPRLVLDEALPGRIAAALSGLPEPARWSVAGAGGLGPAERRHLALYATDTPAIPDPTGPHPLLDLMPDLLIVNTAFARSVLPADRPLPETALEPILAVEGYLASRAALYLPGLVAGIDGALLSRDVVRLTAELQRHFGDRLAGQTIATLAGNVTIPAPAETGAETPPAARRAPARPIDKAIADVIRSFAAPVGLSVVVRTRFDRMHLLERLLTSLSRARHDAVDMEVILATDAAPDLVGEHLAALRQRFCNLALRVQQTAATAQDTAHSRVGNMLAGLMAARQDYVVLIDDDDYVDLFAFEPLLAARFMGSLPLIVTGSDLHNETWEKTPSGRWVLSQSTPRGHYGAEGWRDMFTGVNRLPINAPIMPRAWLQARLGAFDFRHDLSEDYALFLLLFTDPDLPAIFESPATFCHISIRGRANTVTQPDRRPWARDIACFLQDLTTERSVAGPGLWQMLQGRRQGAGAVTGAAALADMRTALDRAQQDVAALMQECGHLRRLAQQTGETVG